MASKHRLALAFSVLAALALVAVLFLLRDPRPAGDSAMPEAETTASDGSQLPKAPLDPVVRSTASEPQPATRVDPEVALHGAWARVFVEGLVRGGEGELEHSLVIVRPGPLTDANRAAAASLSAWKRPEADGRFRIEISHLFPRDATLHVTELDLQLAVDGRLPQSIAVPVPFTRAELAKDGEFTVPAEFTLTALCDITGRISVPTPAGLESVKLAALSRRGDRPGAPLAYAQVDGASDEFRLRIPCGTPCFLLVFVPGLRPTTLELDGRAENLGRLELDLGARIAGHWSAIDYNRRRSLLARPHVSQPGDRFVVLEAEFEWLDGRFEWASSRSNDIIGDSFEISGLAPGVDYVLETGRDGEWQLEADVRAPADDVEIVAESAVIAIRATGVERHQTTIKLRFPDGRERLMPVQLRGGSNWHLRAPAGSTVTVLSPDGRTLGELTLSSGSNELLISP